MLPLFFLALSSACIALNFVTVSRADPCPTPQEIVHRMFGMQPLQAMKVPEAGEKAVAGVIYEGSMSFASSYPDGVYLYVIDDQQRVGWSRRVIDRDLENPLVTHRAIVSQMERRYGHSPRVMAAGEVHVRAGKIKRINNKSGTYWGGEDRLKLADDVLSRRGLELGPTVERVDVSVLPRQKGHHTDLQDALIEVQLSLDEDGKKFLDAWLSMKKVLSEAYPGRAPGSVDFNAYFSSGVNKLAKKSKQVTRGNPEDTLMAIRTAYDKQDEYALLRDWMSKQSAQMDVVNKGKSPRIKINTDPGDYPITRAGLREATRQLRNFHELEGFLRDVN